MLKYILPLLFLFPFIGVAQNPHNIPDSVEVGGKIYKTIKEENTVFIIKNNGDTTYIIVEQMPEFPGGQSELFKYLSSSVKFPPEAKNNGIMGKVFINFTIDKDGSIQNIRVIKSVHTILDNEALRVINSMPKWTPGSHKGKKVRVNYNIPINFIIHGGTKSTFYNNNKAQESFESEDYEKAVYYYNKVLKFRKNESNLYLNRGIAYHKIGKTKKAIKDLEKAKELGSKEAEEYLKNMK